MNRPSERNASQVQPSGHPHVEPPTIVLRRILGGVVLGFGLLAVGCAGEDPATAGGLPTPSSAANNGHDGDFVDGTLLHEEILSRTSSARFYETGRGEAMVLIQGSVDLDRTSPLDNAPSANTLPDYFRALYPGSRMSSYPPH
jgi:hypothetical protein